ncbi:hypothetical protein T492DRAFT_242539 [Pavlovales sp. CCMP2436]|nr:hypothetical protein T492DRAFT_242539 [Pavlovales sp. CCMP2436]
MLLGCALLALSYHPSGQLRRPIGRLRHRSGTIRAAEASDALREEDEVDIAIIGAGLGGLAAAAVLTQRYGKKVGVFEAHYAVGGVAHAFESGGYTFDAGPTIVLGCSSPPYSPLRQVLNAAGVADAIDWIPYNRWDG